MADRRSRRRTRVIVLLVGVLALGGAVGAAKLALDARRASRASTALDRGLAAYEAGDYENAMRNLGTASSRIKDRPDLYYALADSRRRIREENGRHIPAAIAFARAARDLTPDDPRPRIMLIELYITAGFLSELLTEADRVLSIEPENRTALEGRCVALVSLGRREEAIAAAEALVSAYPDDADAAEVLLATLTNASRDPAAIRDRIDRLESRLGNDPRFITIQAEAALRAGDQARAIERVRAAAALDPSDPIAVARVVAMCDALFGEDGTLFDLGSRVASRAIARADAHPEIAGIVLFRDWRLARFGAAREHLASIDPAAPGVADSTLGWGAHLLMGVDPAGADRFAAALASRPETPASTAWLASLDLHRALETGNVKAAVEALGRVDAAIAASPEREAICPPAEMARVRLALAGGDLVAAESGLTRLGLERGWLIARLELLQLMLDQGRIAEAAALINRDAYARQIPGLVEVFARAVATLIASGRVADEALPSMVGTLRQFAEAIPESQELRAYLAVALRETGRSDQAAPLIASIDPAEISDQARILLALAGTAGEPATIDAEALLRSPPREPQALLSTALALHASGRPDAARALFDAAMQGLAPEARMPFRAALGAYLDRVRDPGAAEVLRALARDFPDQALAQLAMLESDAAWTSHDGLADAIARLRAITGERAAGWRLHEARRLLVYDTTQPGLARAISLLTEARAVSWPNHRISELLADAALRAGDPTRAVRHLAEGAQGSPAGVSLFPRLVLLLRERGDPAEASRYLDVFLTQQFLTTDLVLARAELAFSADRFEEARRDYERLAERGDPRGEIGLAATLAALGRAREAEAAYERIIARPDAAPAAFLSYANYLGLTGHIDRAVALLSRLPEEIGGVPRHRFVAELIARHAPEERAEAVLRELADTGDAVVAGRLATFLVERGRVEDAVRAAEHYLQRFPGDEGLREVRALARIQGATTGAAADIAELAAIIAERQPGSPYATLTAIMLEHSRGTINDEQYLERIRAITRSEPTFLPAYAILVTTLQGLGRMGEAADAATRAATVSQGSASAAEMAARALFGAQRHAEAEAMVRRWKDRLARPIPDPDILSAEIALSQGRAPAARAALTGWLDALAASPRAPQDLRPLLSATLMLTGDRTRAASFFSADTLQAADAEAYLRTSVLMAPSSPAAAQEWLLQGLDRLSEPGARLFVASQLHTLGTARNHRPALEATITVLDRLAGDGHRSPAASAIRASTHTALGQTEQAIAAYRDAIDQQPDDVLSLNNLANILSRSPGTAPEAVTLAQRALGVGESAGLPPAIIANLLDTLGVALLAAGDAPSAAAAFRRGLDLDRNSTGCQVGIVEALVAQGDTEGARVAMRAVQAAAAQADPEVGPRLDRVRIALQQ